jgi:exosortase/archaeosortase family protein
MNRALPLLHFAAWFVALYGTFHAVPGLPHWVIDHATVQPAAALLGWIDPALQARAQGARLLVPGGGLQVLPGCEGTDLALLATAAMLAAPLRWRWRLLGAALALLVMASLNQVRLLLLLQAHRNWPQHFDALHSLWLPLLLVLVLLALVMGWTARWHTR